MEKRVWEIGRGLSVARLVGESVLVIYLVVSNCLMLASISWFNLHVVKSLVSTSTFILKVLGFEGWTIYCTCGALVPRTTPPVYIPKESLFLSRI